jgi:hypothetical protein
MSHRLLAGAAALALLAAPAVAAADVLRFDAIDAVDTGRIRITSVGDFFVVALTGATAAGTGETLFYTHNISSSPTGWAQLADHCQRVALMALAKPGRFTLEVTFSPGTPGVGRLERCKLVRND